MNVAVYKSAGLKLWNPTIRMYLEACACRDDINRRKSEIGAEYDRKF